jgi:hypothetical protein
LLALQDDLLEALVLLLIDRTGLESALQVCELLTFGDGISGNDRFVAPSAPGRRWILHQ